MGFLIIFVASMAFDLIVPGEWSAAFSWRMLVAKFILVVAGVIAGGLAARKR